jgi:5'-nucleotidase
MGKSNIKELVLLHSNDMHGDFLAEDENGVLTGGISRLSGYVEKARRENPNVLYCIAGDMLQGSLIDTEFRGVSTISIMNLLHPDIVSLGNHEVDYGLSHLLFLERCAAFPIVNANLFIKNPFTRLFSPYKIFKKDGMRIMFIGIITEEVLAGIKSDALISKLIDIDDAAQEVGRICNAHRTTDIDFTILLTHIGFEEDKQLAALLDPEWGVDVIIGGHSHTVLEQPAEVNGILIAQAGVGTDQLGRFDIKIDTDTNSVASYTWQLVPIDDKHCPHDQHMEDFIAEYKGQTDEKYGQILARFPRTMTHPDRYRETELGDLMADAFRESLGVDIALFGSGSLRGEEAGPVLTLGDLIKTSPYSEKVFQLKATGEQTKRIWLHILREEALTGGHTEFFQISHDAQIVYSRATKAFESFLFKGEPLDDEALYTLAIQEFHRNNCETSLGISLDELLQNGKEIVLATAEHDILIEYFLEHPYPEVPKLNRLTVC